MRRPELRVFFRKRKRKVVPQSSSTWPTTTTTNYHNCQQIELRTKMRQCDRDKLAPRTGRERRSVAKFGRPFVVVPFILLLVLAAATNGAIQARQAKTTMEAEAAKQLAAGRNTKTTSQDGDARRDLPAKEANNKLLAAATATAALSRSEANLSEAQPGADTTGAHRRKRAAQSAELMRMVAVSGQWIELQCPLVSELMPAPGATAAPAESSQQQLYSIQWRKNGVRLDQLNPRYKINPTNGSLVIANSQPKVDEANYECWLVHRRDEEPAHDQHQPAPIKSHRLELRLLVAPRVAPFEFPADAQVGMKLVLTCSVLEGQQPISFVWLKDNKVIGEDQGRPMASSLSQLHQQQLADRYALSPIAYSVSNSGYKAEYLLQANSSSALGMGLDSSSTISSTDQQHLLPLLSDSNIRVRQSDDYSILSIDKLELKHSGRYTCSVQNEAARTSHSSQLLINAPPTLTTAPRDADLVSGQSASIECAASGQPRPSISWLRARETTDSGSKQWDYVPVYDNLRFTSLANGSLAILNITQREQGFYLCSAKNPFGTEMSKLAKISVHEPAKFSTKYKTVEVRIEESASLLCLATGELPLTIEWRNKEEIPIQANDKRFMIDHEPQDLKKPANQELAANQMVNATVSRLILAKSQRSDSGHYSCHARNKFGSDKMVTNLLVQDVPDKVIDLKVTNTTSSSVFLRWQLPFSGNSPVTSYLVQYLSDDPLDDLLVSMGSATGGNQQQQQQQPRLRDAHLDGVEAGDKSATSSASPLKVALEALNADSVPDEAIDRTLVEQTVEQSATHLAVKDLSPFCVYRLRLAAINKIGLGEFSDWIRAKTEEAPPGGSASKIVAAATGPNSIKVSWSPPDRRAWNGQLVGFNIGYRPIDSTFELNKTIEWASPSLQSMVLDARNKQLSAKSSRPDQTAPKLGPNSAPDPSELANYAAGQHPFGGQNSSTNSGLVGPTDRRYSLRQHLRQLLALQQQELVAHLTNLQRSTTYLLWIQAINGRGQGPQSHAVSVKTLDDVPPSAPAIKIQATGASSITIAWSMLSNFVSSANQYSLFYRKVALAPQPTPPVRLNSSSEPGVASNQLDDPQQQQQQPHLAYGASSRHHGLAELGQSQAFIERSITSQQLMASGNMNLLMSDYEPHTSQADAKFSQHLQQQQQQQHYQQFVYTLDQLDCGSVYELYMSTRNSVGKSEPSAMISTRTLGEPPLAPINKNNFFSKIGTNEVALNLAAWSTGGCPVSHMTVRYKQSPLPQASASNQNNAGQQPIGGSNSSSSSAPSPPTMSVSWPITTSVPASLLNALNNQQHSQRATHYLSTADLATKGPTNEPAVYYLRNLMPGSCYELEVVAYNMAGHSSAQYEFVTANLNGSRAGYSRREGVYRVEMGGLAHEQLFAADESGRASNEQQMQAFKQGSSAQILPLLLMGLCMVCLIISSVFCYHRLALFWKQAGARRRNSNDTSSRGHGGASHSSPGSVGGKSSMWANVGDSVGARYGALPGAGRHLPDGGGEPMRADSPTTTLHYCMREPLNGNQATLSATLNPKSMAASSASTFSQSVSMKDFSLAHGAKLPVGPATGTLNYKNCSRATLRQPHHYKATTLRARLFSGGGPSEATFAAGQDNLACSSGATLCKRPGTNRHHGGNHVDLVRNGSLAEPDGANQATSMADPYSTHQFNFTQDNQQLQQETSWTNHYQEQSCIEQQQQANGAAYAVPATSNNYANEQLVNDNYGTRQALGDHMNPAIQQHNQSNIEACIQQLMGQQYQQQPYSMVMNFKQDRCQYDTAKSAAGQMGADSGSSNLLRSQQQQTVACPAPFMDSSSSSSGIDVGAHLECASTTTGTSNSNTSNDAYLQHQQQQQQYNHRPSHFNGNGSEFTNAEQYSLQNVMQQFNEPV